MQHQGLDHFAIAVVETSPNFRRYGRQMSLPAIRAHTVLSPEGVNGRGANGGFVMVASDASPSLQFLPPLAP